MDSKGERRVAGVVLIHGAWHGAWCWDAVVAELEQLGVPSVAVELPLTGFVDDVLGARRAIEAAGLDTVVVGHSYGGFVVSEAATGAPGIRHLVYVAAFMTDADDDANAILTDELSDALVPGATGLHVDPVAARRIFFGDSDDETARDLVARLRPMPLTEGLPNVSDPAWKAVPSTYVMCSNDRALLPAAQRRMAAHAASVVEWPTDHSPFLTRPKELAELLVSHLP